MAVFAYTATDLDASVTNGTVVADTPRQARDQLRERGLSVHELVEHGAATGRGRDGAAARRRLTLWRGGPRQRRRQRQVVALVRELSTLLGVGMPLLEALDTAVRQQPRGLRPAILALRDRIAAGASLAEAMREQPQVFDSITVAMTEVGEDAGTLDVTLTELASFKERSAQFRGRLTSALIYPLIVLTVAVGVSLFLMTYVVPRLVVPLQEAGRELPLVTQIVKSVSDFLLGWWWALLLGLFAFGVATGAWLRTATGRWLAHAGMLKLPAVGELVCKQAVVRIAFVIATLMRSGIAFEHAVAIAQRSTANVVLRDALVRCERAVEAGRDIAAALDQTRAFPPTVIQVFALGQQSGQMDVMLERLANDYDRQVASAATQLSAALEPVLIVLLAALVGTIAFATILPMLQIGQTL